MPHLLHGQEREVLGDRGYLKEADREAFRQRGIRYRVNRRGHPQAPLTESWRAINCARSRTRARGEHAFLVAKRLWGFTKVRYRRIAKNSARAFAAFARANLCMVRHRLTPSGST